jgi:hypothetical protein
VGVGCRADMSLTGFHPLLDKSLSQNLQAVADQGCYLQGSSPYNGTAYEGTVCKGVYCISLFLPRTCGWRGFGGFLNPVGFPPWAACWSISTTSGNATVLSSPAQPGIQTLPKHTLLTIYQGGTTSVLCPEYTATLGSRHSIMLPSQFR